MAPLAPSRQFVFFLLAKVQGAETPIDPRPLMTPFSLFPNTLHPFPIFQFPIFLYLLFPSLCVPSSSTPFSNPFTFYPFFIPFYFSLSDPFFFIPLHPLPHSQPPLPITSFSFLLPLPSSCFSFLFYLFPTRVNLSPLSTLLYPLLLSHTPLLSTPFLSYFAFYLLPSKGREYLILACYSSIHIII